MKNSNVKGLIDACEEKTEENKAKIDKLALAFVDGTLSQDVYEAKLKSLNIEKARLVKEKEDLDLRAMSETDALSKLSDFRNAAIESGGKKLENFSKDIFDTTIERIIVGGYDENKNADPFMITFVFKKEFGSSDITESKTNYTIIDGFTHYWTHVVFKPQGNKERAKVQENFIKVKIAISN